MNTLIIDSSDKEITEAKAFSPHERNALILRDLLNADLVTLPEHLEPLRGKVYDKVIFCHASIYTKSNWFVKFLKNTTADLYYVVNDYYLGEAWALWALCRDYGYKFTCIANHDSEASKVCVKNVIEWHNVNLNCLVYKSLPKKKALESVFFNVNEHLYDILYFGAYRSGRQKYFKKYFDPNFIVSTSRKNIQKFESKKIYACWMPSLNWWGTGNTLYNFRTSLYLEDEATHVHYSRMGNRFYEALSYGIPSFFDSSCKNTIEKSGYPIHDFFVVDSKEEIQDKLLWHGYPYYDLDEQKAMAEEEKKKTLEEIKRIIE